MAKEPTTQHDPARDDPKPEESRRDWENVQTNKTDKTERLRIQGGWLYCRTFGDKPTMTFVPDQVKSLAPSA